LWRKNGKAKNGYKNWEKKEKYTVELLIKKLFLGIELKTALANL